MYAKMGAILKGVNREFGLKSRLFSLLAGPFVLWKVRQEEKRLAAGWTYEPPTFYERNDAVENSSAKLCSQVTVQRPSADPTPSDLVPLPVGQPKKPITVA